AEHVLGVLDSFAGDKAGGERRWRTIASEHPESRWAWVSAAALLEPDTVLGDYMLERSSPELLASLDDAPPSPLALRDPEEAIERALEWLPSHRRADGTWADPSELEGSAAAANSISVAVDLLAARALLAHRGRHAVDVEHEADFALRTARASLAAR